MKAAFDYFDVDGDGNIEYEEFVNTLKALDIGLSDDQARLRRRALCACRTIYAYSPHAAFVWFAALQVIHEYSPKIVPANVE